MKKLVLTSLILILVPTLLFLPAYGYLIYTANTNAHDYKEDVQGQWEAIQYYYGKDRVACKDDIWMKITFDEDTIVIDGTVLPATESKLFWESGTSLSFEANGEKMLYLLSFDAQNNLKIIIDGTPYIIVLRRIGG